VATEIN